MLCVSVYVCALYFLHVIECVCHCWRVLCACRFFVCSYWYSLTHYLQQGLLQPCILYPLKQWRLKMQEAMALFQTPSIK